MFNTHFRQIYFICDNLVVRTLRTRKLGPNPGLDKRSRVFQKEGLQFDDNAEDFIEESEGNFFETGKIYNQTVKDKIIQKETLRHQIVAQKYFKEHLPNLLTWSEKEQIRYLHSKDPDEWTPDRLAESFPVTAAVVKKLIKYPWKPSTQERIARHDASAMRNWKELKEDTLEIPPELKEHFLKFSNRTIPPLDKKSIKIDISLKEKMGEFEAIVNRCAKSDQPNNFSKTHEVDNNKSPSHKNKNETQYHKKLLTLEELTTKIKNRQDKGYEIKASDQMILQDHAMKSENDLVKFNKDEEIIEFKDRNTEITAFSEAQTGIVKIKDYPERIRIPKKAFKKGATYKVDDCYYDYDGIFLYRVIGM